MKAIDTELTKFLGAEAQYYVPIYQRKYSWKKDNCLKLIDDILKVAKDNERPCHFIGSVIYLAKQDAMHASAVKEYLVIDGASYYNLNCVTCSWGLHKSENS